MTGADLNSSAKPWEIQEKTTKVVYEEFYDQVKLSTVVIVLSPSALPSSRNY